MSQSICIFINLNSFSSDNLNAFLNKALTDSSTESNFFFFSASLVPQMVKNLPAMLETRVQSLGQEEPLEKGMQPTPVSVPGEFHGQRSLAGYSPQDHEELDTTERLTHIHKLL